MNSKERVLAAINHREPDLVPIDHWAISPVTDRLRTHLGVDTDEGVWQALGIDLRSVWPAYSGPGLATFDDGSWMDWWGCRRKMMGPFEEVVDAPLADAESLADLEAFPWPDAGWFDVQGMRQRCAALDQYAVVIRDAGPFATCVLRVAMFLRTMPKFMMDMASNPDFATALVDRIAAFYLDLNHRILETVGDLTDIYFIADDVGVQDKLMISPQMFRRFIKPRLTRFIQQAHQHGQKVMYHTCGAVRPLIPDFIEMGVDILDPIQVSARGMDPLELKPAFGNVLSFHGALDIQTVLSSGTPDQVRAEVERLLQIMAPGGGFILAPTNNVMPETPVENVTTMYRTARSAR